MENIKEIHKIAKKNSIQVILDATRIMENSQLIREREPKYSNKSIKDIILEFCSYSDGCTMSASKDFLVDTGGFIAVNDDELSHKIQDTIMLFGDGLSIRSKAALNKAVIKGFKHEKWVVKRVRKSEFLWKKLKNSNVPLVSPAGGHGVFINSEELFQYLPENRYPENAFLVKLYLDFGIIASQNIITPIQQKLGIKMIRFAIPLKQHTLLQLSYVAKSVSTIWKQLDQLKGLKRIYQPPGLSGSFLAHYSLD